MEKLKMHSPERVERNLDRLAELFPGCVAEARNEETGELARVVDLDLLRQSLAGSSLEGPRERYQLDWPGKKASLLAAGVPLAKTLRPIRAESVSFDATRNLFIEGDNLDVLKLIQETYLGKIKLIYIDPPYNTGSDFIYCDNFQATPAEYKQQSMQADDSGRRLVANLETNGRFHSDWLSMMNARLRLASNLLRDDGVIFISIDDNEVANLRKLCDESFGAHNFVCTFIWNKQHSQQQGLFKKYHEYVLLYAKNAVSLKNISGGDGIIDAGALKKVSRANPASDFTFPPGVRFEAPDGFELSGTYGESEKVTVVSGRLRAAGGVTAEAVTLSAGWTQKEQMRGYFSGADVVDTKGQRVVEFYFSSTGKLKCRKERSKITPSTLLPTYGMVSEQTAYLASIFGKSVFDNPKPVQMLRDFISWFVDADDIVLDFFAGSGTTCEALLRESPGARFIAVQLPAAVDSSTEAGKNAISLGLNTICEIGKERIRRIGAELVQASEGSSEPDVGFRVLRVDSSNMTDVYYSSDEFHQKQLALSADNVKSDRTQEDLLFQVLVDWGVDLALPIERIIVLDRTVFLVDGNALVACFESGVDEALVRELATLRPLRAVFRDGGYASDSTKINVEQIFKLLSPETEVRSL